MAGKRRCVTNSKQDDRTKQRAWPPSMPKTKARISLIIDDEMCKGCGLCVSVCPRQTMGLAAHINTRGFHPAVLQCPEECTGCAQCAIMCPDCCITIVKCE